MYFLWLERDCDGLRHPQFGNSRKDPHDLSGGMQVRLEVLCGSMPTTPWPASSARVSSACSKSRALCRSAAASRFIPFIMVFSFARINYQVFLVPEWHMAPMRHLQDVHEVDLRWRAAL